MKKKIFISKILPPECLEPYLDRYEFTMPEYDSDTSFSGSPFSYEKIIELLPGHDAYFDVDILADKPVIDTCVNNGIKALAVFGVGYDKIDVKYATEVGFPILNTPTTVTEATAELCATLIFSTMRGVPRYDKEVRQKVWLSPLFSDRNTMIAGSTLGIVGFGRIGKRVCRKAQGMGMKVVYFDQYRATPEVEAEYDVTYLPFEELVKTVDCISLHAPYFAENHHMFNADVFKMMKPSAYFVNGARGKLVDEVALYEALRDGVIKGAGLDVFESEPNDVYPPLLELDNVVMTPHIASCTMRSRVDMAKEGLDGLTAILEGRIPHNVVNPSVFEKK